jgi:RimJ/RimL family protein N-acetyltransferase
MQVVRRHSIMETIETERLELVPLSLADAAALVNGHRPEGARWSDGYPTDGTLVAAGFVVTAEAEGRSLGPWSTYQMTRRSDGVVIGDCGFLGPPDHHGWVHVGYGVVGPERDQGYATEALTALIAWAKDRPEVTRVLADTACTNVASIRVMEGAGMRRAGSDGSLVYFEG